jgi:hypothetical protein
VGPLDDATNLPVAGSGLDEFARPLYRVHGPAEGNFGLAEIRTGPFSALALHLLTA